MKLEMDMKAKVDATPEKNLAYEHQRMRCRQLKLERAGLHTKALIMDALFIGFIIVAVMGIVMLIAGIFTLSTAALPSRQEWLPLVICGSIAFPAGALLAIACQPSRLRNRTRIDAQDEAIKQAEAKLDSIAFSSNS